MKQYSAAILAALASGHAVPVQLVRMDYTSGTIGLNSSNWHFTYGGVTYQGAAGLGTVAEVDDSPGEIKGLEAVLLNVDAAYMALALDSNDEVKGTPFTLMTGLLDTSTYQMLTALVDWTGTLDTMSIAEDGTTATIRVTIESNGVRLLQSVPRMLSDADQQALYRGDKAFEFIVSQTGQPVVWPAREYFLKP